MVQALTDLLADAEAGRIDGLLWVVRAGRGDNRANVAGEYRRHPGEALKATFALERLLRDDIE